MARAVSVVRRIVTVCRVASPRTVSAVAMAAARTLWVVAIRVAPVVASPAPTTCRYRGPSAVVSSAVRPVRVVAIVVSIAPPVPRSAPMAPTTIATAPPIVPIANAAPIRRASGAPAATRAMLVASTAIAARITARATGSANSSSTQRAGRRGAGDQGPPPRFHLAEPQTQIMYTWAEQRGWNLDPSLLPERSNDCRVLVLDRPEAPNL